MNVETYEVNEIRQDCVDDKTELLAISEKLGLFGQQSLLCDQQPTTFPYRKISVEETRVYETLLTSKCKLNEYAESVIPLRILQVAAHASEYPQCAYLQVWFNPSMKDPLLIGRKEQYGGDAYILARWGEILEAFPILKKKAIEKLLPAARVAFQKAKSELAQYEIEIADRCEAWLNGTEARYAPTVY